MRRALTVVVLLAIALVCVSANAPAAAAAQARPAVAAQRAPALAQQQLQQRAPIARAKSAAPAPPPCQKPGKKAKLVSIEQRYPTLVTDFHPVVGSVDPNMLKGKDVDREARVIIREHLAWERENPAPPHNPDTRELKEMGLKVGEQTLEIQKEAKQFKNLAKFVDDDAADYQRAEKARVAKAAALVVEKEKDAQAKIESAKLLDTVAKQRSVVQQQKAALAANKAQPGKPQPASAKINVLKAQIAKL